ncbi:MAG TPA: long-chain fatty acid--CoA ligase [Vicinamibacterales bacterium]|nr:long-chain fatty acid--CoA ligase [Vicinamibacterales bacterium]
MPDTNANGSIYAARPWLKHYDYWVRRNLSYPGRPLYEILSTTAVETPDADATAFLGATLSYRELKRRTDRLAAGLVRLGVVKGDRVGVMLPNCPQYVISAFATLRLGAVVVNINPIYTSRELMSVADDSGIKVLITLDRLAPLAHDVCGQTHLQHVVVTSLGEYSAEQAPPPRVEPALAFSDLIAMDDGSDLPRVAIAPDDLAVLQYTGGTTGTPKAAMLTHANIFANVVQNETWHYRTYHRGEGRYLVVIPYFHIYAFTVCMMTGVWVGGLQIIIPKYDVEAVLAAIRDFQPTYFPAVPTVYVSLLAHPKVKDYNLDQVRTFNTGGAPCPIEVIEEFETRIGRTLNEGYGLSETSPVTHSTPHLGRRKPGTIGLPMPDTDFKIVDVETGANEMPLGESGELCICGPQVMKGYWRKPDESANVLREDADGRVWFHTGDVATMDADGYTSIVQRKKDMIIVDGFNVYPSEVEGVLYTHTAVRMVAVIGIPDKYHGEVVKACVVPRDADVSVDELRAYCKKNLAAYKVPTEIELRDSLPQSTVGKILYRVLRDEAARKPVS